MRRLQTLLTIIRAITSNRNDLLLELASALVPWQQGSQHMQQDESRVILPAGKTQAQPVWTHAQTLSVCLYATMTLSKQAF